MIVLTVGATDGDAVGFFVGDYFMEKIRWTKVNKSTHIHLLSVNTIQTHRRRIVRRHFRRTLARTQRRSTSDLLAIHVPLVIAIFLFGIVQHALSARHAIFDNALEADLVNGAVGGGDGFDSRVGVGAGDPAGGEFLDLGLGIGGWRGDKEEEEEEEEWDDCMQVVRTSPPLLPSWEMALVVGCHVGCCAAFEFISLCSWFVGRWSGGARGKDWSFWVVGMTSCWLAREQLRLRDPEPLYTGIYEVWMCSRENENDNNREYHMESLRGAAGEWMKCSSLNSSLIHSVCGNIWLNTQDSIDEVNWKVGFWISLNSEIAWIVTCHISLPYWMNKN